MAGSQREESIRTRSEERIGAKEKRASPLLDERRKGRVDLGFTRGLEDDELLPDLAAKLVSLKVDIIVTPGNPPATLAAQQATSTIPIVFISAADPVASGFVTSLARPGGNITGGTSLVGPGLVGKRLELLQEVVPKVSRVAVLSNPTTPDARVFIGEAEVAARSLKVQLQVVEARGPVDFLGAFAAMTKERASAILMQQDAIGLRR